jgi:hypothetical protein
MRRDIVLTRYRDGKTRICGGVLDQVEVLEWQGPEGRRVVYLDEFGRIRNQEIVGRIRVRLADIKARSPAMARRAALSNTDDLDWALGMWTERGELFEPDLVWLAVRRELDYKSDVQPDLPPWALGCVIVEEEKPLGTFGVLGHARPDEMDRFQGPDGWYAPLLVDEFGAVDPTAGGFTP